MIFSKRIIGIITAGFLSIVPCVSAEEPISRNSAYYLHELEEATHEVFTELQPEINQIHSQVKDRQLLPEAILKRISLRFKSSTTGSLQDKLLASETEYHVTTAMIESYLRATWDVTDLLQRRMAMEKDGSLKLKSAIAPAVIAKIVDNFSEETGAIVRIVSDGHDAHLARNPMNSPTTTEKRVLEQFSADSWNPIFKQGGKISEEQYMMMSPIYVQASCLPCHGAARYKAKHDSYAFVKEGYQVGDVIGAFSVILPIIATK